MRVKYTSYSNRQHVFDKGLPRSHQLDPCCYNNNFIYTTHVVENFIDCWCIIFLPKHKPNFRLLHMNGDKKLVGGGLISHYFQRAIYDELRRACFKQSAI